jgi:PAS domain S-box-containing protein
LEKSETKPKKMEEKEKQHIANLEFLSRTAMEFVELSPKKDIYQLIGERLKELVGDSIVGVSSFDESSNSLCVRTLLGLGRQTGAVLKLMGRYPVGMSLKNVDDEAKLGLTTGKLTKVPGGLYRLLFREVPEPICRTIEKLLDLSGIYGMGLRRKEKLFGTVIIMARRGTGLGNKSTIETFVNQASVALERKQAEEALQKIYDELETKVKEQTANLLTTNETLQKDITERKKIEKELKNSKDIYETLVENSPIGVYYNDFKGVFLYGNRKAEEIVGYKREELIGKSFLKLKLLDPQDMSKAVKLLALNRLGKPTGPDEFILNRKDSSKRTVEIRTLAINIGGKKAILGLVEDITERKQAEEELRESEEQYRDLFENANDLIQCVMPNGHFLYVNKTWRKILGYSKEEVADLTLWDIVHSDFIPHYKKVFQKVMSGETVSNVEAGFVARDGKLILVEGNVNCRLKEGKPVSTRGIFRDITKRKKMEEQLKESEQRFRTIFDDATDGMLLAGREPKKFYTGNKMICQMLGYSLQEIKNLGVMDIYPQKDLPYVTEQFEKQLRKEISLARDIPLKRKDGSVFYVDINSSPLTLAGKTYLLGIFRDITERKNMEKEFLRTQKLESLGILAGGIAHDFNNILTVIMGNITLAKMYAKDEERVLGRLKEAEKASLQARDLARQLVTFSKGGAPVKEISSIGELIKDTSNFVLRGSSAQCKFSLPDDLWSIEVDRGQLSQVIQNMVINANQAMPKGGAVKVQVENSTLGPHSGLPLSGGKYVKISIQDEGIGIPVEHLPKIFDPYFTTKKGSSGLGLAAAHSIIKNHNGHIAVKSAVGLGTTFSIYLPASEGKVPRRKTEEERLIVGKGKILIMDDEEMVREIAGKMAKHLGYEVELTPDGLEAIESYKKAKDSDKPFSAVIMDLTIPDGLGGKEAIKELLEIDPKARVIVSSGYSDDPIMANFRKYGFNGVIAKPYKIEELSRALHTVMMKKRRN